jgi:hypothetical protein
MIYDDPKERYESRLFDDGTINIKQEDTGYVRMTVEDLRGLVHMWDEKFGKKEKK